ncbi:ATP-grasp domain-containing protein [Kineococcus sp. LSe6-4]|uniref:ATP-grasp domain-containing protein n=1 Tax=Kineococcus halophytocola TaxID=3234027 RepID=A0ABV4GYN1_9ACTN
MSRALCVIARAATVALRLAPGRGDRRLFLSYTRQVPLAAEFESLTFWMADAYAARLQLAGLAPELAAPPWDWLSGLDPGLLGRQVVSTTLDRVHEQVPAGPVFLKPALLKLPGTPAGVWDVADFRRAALAEGADPGLQVQCCRQVLDLDHEHRFVVCEGAVLTGSPYRVAGRAWSRSLRSDRSPEAAAFARQAVRALGADCPPVCALDVAWDRGNRRWLIVEANPLWASGPYDCDPATFVDAVEHAHGVGAGRWAWRAEPTQLARARAAEPVVAVGQDEASGYAEFGA